MGGVSKALFGEKSKQVGPKLGDVMQYATPWAVSALGIGGTTVDKEGRTISTTIDPKMQELADMFRERMGMQTAAIAGYDPTQAARDYYSQYVEPDLLEQQERERLSLENRLLGQGMLGATGGALRMGDLFRAQSAEQRAGRAGAFTQAQDLLNQMRQREAADLAAMAGIYEAPVGLMQTGVGIGQVMGGIAGSYQPSFTKAQPGLFQTMAGSFAQGYGQSMSDFRLKENVVKIGITDKGLNWYKWDWNDKAKELGVDNHRTTGVMAQEIMNIIPEAISLADNGYYQVDYSKVV